MSAAPAADLQGHATGSSSTVEYFEGVSWHEMCSSAVKTIKTHMMTRSGLFHIVFLSVYTVVIERITQFHTARSGTERSDHPAPLYDLTWDIHDPYVLVLQWLSSLLEPGSSVLRVVLSSGGFASLQDFIASDCVEPVRCILVSIKSTSGMLAFTHKAIVLLALPHSSLKSLTFP